MKLSKVAIAFLLFLGVISSKRLTEKKSDSEWGKKRKLSEECDPTTLIDECDSGLVCHEVQKKCFLKNGENCSADEACLYGKCKDKKCKATPEFNEYCKYKTLGNDCGNKLNCDKETKKCLREADQECKANEECYSKHCDEKTKKCLSSTKVMLNKASDVASAAGKGISKAASAVGSGISKAASAAGEGISTAASAVKDAASTAGRKLSAAGKALTDTQK
jgi:hypothetical protein